jgi:hypothetical protein
MSKTMHRLVETDNGTVVVYPSVVKACGLSGNEVNARHKGLAKPIEYAVSKFDKDFRRKMGHSSRINSPTATACHAIRAAGSLPPSLGGTDGKKKIDGYCKDSKAVEEQGDVAMLMLVAQYEALDREQHPLDHKGRKRH